MVKPSNKERHRQVKFCDDDEVPNLINSPFFRELNPIDDDTYEVESSKKKIELDLPLQVGFFVYQYAKLRMLQFYYDFLDKYLHRSDFKYCEMDTDSAYIAISGECLEDLVISLCSKTYYCFGAGKTNLVAKGLTKRIT